MPRLGKFEKLHDHTLRFQRYGRRLEAAATFPALLITRSAPSPPCMNSGRLTEKGLCLDRSLVSELSYSKAGSAFFSDVAAAATDPILGLTDAFRADPRTGKVNLSVGVYQDAEGASPVLATVKEAERLILSGESTKAYLPISGDGAYTREAARLVFGDACIASGRVASVHTPGGTGALRLAGEFAHHVLGVKQIWISQPTWPNHQGIFAATRLEAKGYPYYEASAKNVDFAGMRAALESASPGDAVLLHACCHNPSGADLDEHQWSAVAKILRERRLLPIVDFAYQGFGDGLEADALGVRVLAEAGLEVIVCSSFSKNFGLYRERVGGLHLLAQSADDAGRVMGQAKALIRTNFSNPPAHGGAIVSTILQSAELRARWMLELDEMRTRIAGMRAALVDGLRAAGARQDFSFLLGQKGMFSFSGLTPEQVKVLRDEHALYIVGNGRINVAGLTPANVSGVCAAITAVL
jgi:aspartate/tyrosine/aromatic aminotransferase